MMIISAIFMQNSSRVLDAISSAIRQNRHTPERLPIIFMKTEYGFRIQFILSNLTGCTQIFAEPSNALAMPLQALENHKPSDMHIISNPSFF
jgi:hypothetical protein